MPGPPLPVTVLIDSLGHGGAERFALHLALELDRARFAPAFLFTRRETDPAHLETLRDAAVPYLELDRSSRFDLVPWRQAIRFLRDRRTAVLHAHRHTSNVWASVLGPTARIPVVIGTEHTWSFTGDPGRRLLDRHLVARMSARVIAVSELDRSKMIEIVRMPRDRVGMIPTGYVPHGSEDAVPTLRSDLGIAADAPLVGTACHFRPQKDLATMIRAFRVVVDRVPAANLVIIGDGEQYDLVAALANELGLAGAVHLPGRRHDVSVAMRDLDVYAMSSAFEGAPLALIEAMMAGLPTVATSVGGIPEMTLDGTVARLVPPHAPAALGEAIAGLLLDPTESARLGGLARQRAESTYRFEVIVEQWSELYERLFAERAA